MTTTSEKVIQAARYWLDYKEKRSDKYCHLRTKEVFPLDAGDGNYTYFGNFCGINPGQWCAMFVTTVITEACGGDREKAKAAMYGVWPYTSCGQIWDVAPVSNCIRASRTARPKKGDIIIFSNDGRSRDHTGIIEDVDSVRVYTIEGNSGNMVRRRQYNRGDSWIYGYIHPVYDECEDDYIKAPRYDDFCYPSIPELSKGNSGLAVSFLQEMLYYFHDIAIDGMFGQETERIVMKFQSENALSVDGVVGKQTWTQLFRMH